jgi:hypothetical protein
MLVILGSFEGPVRASGKVYCVTLCVEKLFFGGPYKIQMKLKNIFGTLFCFTQSSDFQMPTADCSELATRSGLSDPNHFLYPISVQKMKCKSSQTMQGIGENTSAKRIRQPSARELQPLQARDLEVGR